LVGFNGNSARTAGIDADGMRNSNNNIFKLGYALINYFQHYGPRFDFNNKIRLSLRS